MYNDIKKIAVDLLWLRPGGVGGTEFFVRNLFDGFLTLPDDFHFVLLLSKDNETAFGSYLKDERFEKIVVNINSSNIEGRIIWQFLFQNYLLRRNKIKFCFCPVYVRPLFNGGVQYLSVIHDLQVYHYPQYHPFYEVWYTHLIWQSCKRFSKHIVASSDYVRNELIQLYGMRADRVSQIYIPVVTDVQHKSSWKYFEEKYDIKRESYYYTISQAIPHKNLETIIRVIHKLKKDGLECNAKLLITGISGNAMESLNELINELDVKENVLFTGFISDSQKFELLENCKAFLFPSVFEGFGIPLIEAMMLGAKVITTKYTCIPEVTQQKAIYVEDAFDINEWIQKIKEANSILKRKYVFPQYDKQTIAKQYLAVLKRVFNIV